MNELDYEFDIFYENKTDYGLKTIFLRTISVPKDSNIQEFREQLRLEIAASYNLKQIDLKMFKTEAIRKNTLVQIMMEPEPPGIILCSDNNYSIKTVVDNIPSSFSLNDNMGNFFILKPLQRMKIIICSH